MTSAIYPSVEIKNEDSHLQVLTTLRKEHKGKWYLQRFKKSLHFAHVEENSLMFLLYELHKEVYTHIILGEVNENLLDDKGLPIFSEDPSQISEKERLANLIKPKM